jgi:hypothetical protein
MIFSLKLKARYLKFQCLKVPAKEKKAWNYAEGIWLSDALLTCRLMLVLSPVCP